MYLWLVLSTFLAILAGYSVPMRADAPEKINVPVASAHMLKMVINHRSILSYARHSKWPYCCEEVVTYGDVKTCAKDKRICFEPGRVSKDTTNIMGTTSVSNHISDVYSFSDDFLSDIMCFNENGGEADDCKEAPETRKMKILVTYGDLHEKWLSANSLIASEGSSSQSVVSPNEDVITAFRNQFGYDEFVGYVIESSGSADIINYQGKKVFNIPSNMWSVMKSSGVCNEHYNGSCIAYVSVL